jgi:hypothetical protein
LARAYDDIRARDDPWCAINEFFHEWFDYSRDDRAALVAEPIRAGDVSPESDLWRWAVFCAAAADYLCERYQVELPAWAGDPAYTLDEPWYGFGDSGAAAPAVRAHLDRVMPEPLRRRNILGGDRVFANKYELRASLAAARQRDQQKERTGD